MYQSPLARTEMRSGQSDCDEHFLHTNVLLRCAGGRAGEAERHIETILTKAAVAKRSVWISSLLFARVRPSMFVPGRFASLAEWTRRIRSLAILVTPDPNTMLRAARLRDVKWQRPASDHQPDREPRSISLGDAIELASALWVKETHGLPELKFLMFEDRISEQAKDRGRLSYLHLEDYAEGARLNLGAVAPVRTARAQAVLGAASPPRPAPVE
jgi:hypothetical protein